ncbi:MAG TPA: CAP domain-containing protein, partial [Jatrophihabitans sp.]|nr:CAP domain-containing protein [Jatrophihabitans sp.]
HLRASAMSHDLTMARHNTMSHRLRGEAYFTTRISRAGYRWNYAGENIGWSSWMSESGVLALERYMYAERAPYDAHRRTILDRHYRDVGVAVHLDRRHHKVWLTVDFGRQ